MLAGRRVADLLPGVLDIPERLPELLRNLDIALSEQAVDMLAHALEFHPARRPQAAGSFARPIISDLESDVAIPPE
jgi:hypothetical protein